MASVIFIVVTSLVLASTSAFDERLCEVLSSPLSLECCVAPSVMARQEIPYISDCDDVDSTNVCELEICNAKAYGYSGPVNGTYNATALDGIMTKYYRGVPNITELIRNECIYGNLDKYGEFCDLIKVRRCIFNQLVKACPKWDSSTEKCTRIGMLAKKCNHEDIDDSTFQDLFQNFLKRGF